MSNATRYSAAALIATLLASEPAMAGGPFTFKPITIAHTRNVDATAINSTGMIVGTYMDSQTGAPQGFILSGRRVTDLPPPSQCGESTPAYPTAINARGTVTGYCVSEPNEDGWVWRHHSYTSGDDFLAGQRGGGAVILENKSGEVAYTADYGHGWTVPFAGPPASPQQIQGLDDDVTVVSSLNDHGVLAGTTVIGGSSEVFFFGTSGNITTFVPQGATALSGGAFINNLGQVAGTFVNASNVSIGFVYRNGKYTDFGLPNNATAVSVSAINNSGRIVGLYTDSKKNVQRVFYCSGAAATGFNQYPVADVVHLALSDNGTLLVSDKSPSGTSTSYVGTCRGLAC